MVQAWLQAGPLRPATQVHLPVDAGCESCDPMMAPQGPAWDAERHLQVPSSAVHAYSIIICTCMAATLMATLAQAHTGPEAHPSVPQYAPACLPALQGTGQHAPAGLQGCSACLSLLQFYPQFYPPPLLGSPVVASQLPCCEQTCHDDGVLWRAHHSMHHMARHRLLWS